MKALQYFAILIVASLVLLGCPDTKDEAPAEDVKKDVVGEILQEVVETPTDVAGEVAPRQDINLEEFPTIVDSIEEPDLHPVMDILPKDMVEEVVPPQDINLEEFPTIVEVVAETAGE